VHTHCDFKTEQTTQEAQHSALRIEQLATHGQRALEYVAALELSKDGLARDPVLLVLGTLARDFVCLQMTIGLNDTAIDKVPDAQVGLVALRGAIERQIVQLRI